MIFITIFSTKFTVGSGFRNLGKAGKFTFKKRIYCTEVTIKLNKQRNLKLLYIIEENWLRTQRRRNILRRGSFVFIVAFTVDRKKERNLGEIILTKLKVIFLKANCVHGHYFDQC